jgi:tetratricopeptide (TPR) repeat protein
MAKKSRKSTHKRGSVIGSSRADELLDMMEQQMLQGNYEEAIKNSELLLSLLPQRSQQRSIILEQLGAMYGMQEDYAQSYHAYTEALNIETDNAGLWYNRAMAGRRTSHVGQSVRDLERAAELNTDAELAKMIERELKQSRKMAQKELKKRGRDFTLDQLIEQENYILLTHEYMEAGRWVEAEQSLRAAIAIGDYVPQFWANLGTCLIMQERYDEAEAAFKHALQLDRWYTLARHNLRNLPEVRRNGPPKILGVSDSSKRVNFTKFVEYK